MSKRYSILNMILFVLFVISTVIAIVIVSKDIKTLFWSNFVIGYALYLLSYALYLIIVSIMRIRDLRWDEIRKRILKFIMLFVLFSIINYVLNAVIQPTRIDSLRFMYPAFGFSLGLAFLDLALYKKKQTKS